MGHKRWQCRSMTLLTAWALHVFGSCSIWYAWRGGEAFCGCQAAHVPEHYTRENLKMHNLRRACLQLPSISDNLSQTQVVKVNHQATGAEVWLIGCMHFNPFSAWTSGHVVKQLLNEPRRLAAVVLEIYPERWKRIQEWHPAGTPLRELFDNEMQAAAEATTMGGIPLLFGDCSDEALDAIAAEQLQVTMGDFVNFDGWLRIGADLLDGHGVTTNRGADLRHAAGRQSNHGATNMIWGLMAAVLLTLGAPVSLFRTFMVLALEVQYSQTALILLVGIVVPSLALFMPVPGLSDISLFDQVFRDPPLATTAETVHQASSASPMLLDATVAVISVFGVLAITALYRSLLVVVLQKRDSILANSIANACIDHGGPGRVVVAVLGQAHCEGVRQELQIV